MNPDPPYRGRFAPSPTGPLHFGSLVAALGSWLFARRAGGQWLVRIEDLDPPREVPRAAGQQLFTLERFGLVPDAAPWVQSTRGDAYTAAMAALLSSGHAFECHCSRSALAASGGIHRRCHRRHVSIGGDHQVAGAGADRQAAQQNLETECRWNDSLDRLNHPLHAADLHNL